MRPKGECPLLNTNLIDGIILNMYSGYVDGLEIVGGRIGTEVGFGLAFFEEGLSLGLATPLALGTIFAGSYIGGFIGKELGVLIWDVGNKLMR